MGRRKDQLLWNLIARDIIPSSIIETMKALALKGPSTKWDLSSKYSGKVKDGLTRFSYPLILRHIGFLMKIGYVKEYGIRKKPRKTTGRHKKGKSSNVKHETMLYGLSLKGLTRIFMENEEVQKKWHIVEESYPEIKRHNWLRVAMDWANDDRLPRMFPLLKAYGKIRRHYEPNARLFVQALVLTNVYLKKETLAMGYDDAVKLLGKYPRSTIVMFCYGIEQEMREHKEIVERCKTLMEKIKPLRYSSNETY